MTGDLLALIEQARHGSTHAKRQCYERLVGPEQWWLHACRQALVEGYTSWLHLSGSDPLSWAWHLIDEQCPMSCTMYPIIARAIAGCAQVSALLHPLPDAGASPDWPARLVDHLLQAVGLWQQAHLPEQAGASPGDQPALLQYAHTVQWDDPAGDQVNALLRTLQTRQPTWQIAPVADLIAFFHTGAARALSRALSVPILLDMATHGLVADVRLEFCPGGFGQCYPDPQSMAFFHGNRAFREAVQVAWRVARNRGIDDHTADVRWSLTVRPTVHHPATYVPQVAGCSVGAGFALGLLHLLDAQRPPLDPRWAITGIVTGEGAIEPVQGLPTKLAAAHEHGLWSIVPAANLDGLATYLTDHGADGHVRGVATLEQAADVVTRRFRVTCPYRGLDPFTEQDAAHFFGRRRLIEGIANRLAEGPRLLALFGASGSGKSSLIQAGVIPRLRHSSSPRRTVWDIHVVRPADDPFAHLAACGLANTTGDICLAVQARLAAHPDDTRLLLVIDQFEELLVTGSTGLRQRFVEQLLALLEMDALPVTVVMVMRDDFYGRLNHESPELMHWVTQCLFNVPPTLQRDELTSIVRAPALAAGWTFEEGLVETIVQDVIDASALDASNGDAGRSTLLPLLELALTQLWEQGRDGVLTHTAYHAIGKVAGALTRWASNVWQDLTAEHRPIARRIFADLVHLGDDSHGLPDSRRRRTLPELYRDEHERDLVHHVVQHMTRARLLVTTRNSHSGDATVELTHDTLVYAWPLLRQWLNEDRLFLCWRQSLEERIRRWPATTPPSRAQLDESMLLRGHELAEAERWLQQRAINLNARERAYIESSIAMHQRNERTREHRQRRQMVLALGVALILGILLVATLQQRALAERRLAVAESQRLAFIAQNLLNDSPELAVLLAIEAAAIDHNRVVEDLLHQAVQASSIRRVIAGHAGTVTDVAFHPDGHTIVTASTDRTIRLWNVQTGEQQRLLARLPDIANAVAFSPDGDQVATAGANREAYVWDSETGTRMLTLHGHEGSLVDVAFSPNGRWIATASGIDDRVSVSDQTVRVWDARNGTQLLVLRGHTQGVQAVSFSPDGRRIATAGGDRTVRVWDARSGAHLLILRGHEDAVRSVMFSPNGELLLSAGNDQTARLWNAQTGSAQRILRGHDQGLLNAVFSGDGQTIVTTGYDRTIRVWTTYSGEEVHALRGHAHALSSIGFGPDGQHIVTAGHDGTARVWSVSTGRAVLVLDRHTAPVHCAVFSPDGRYLATAGADNTVRVWEAHSGTELLVLRGHAAPVRSVAYSPDGRFLATASEDDTARIWDARTGLAVRQLEGHTGDVVSVAFHPGGHVVVTASNDYTARVWDSATGDQVLTLHSHHAIVSHASFSPNGRSIITASHDQTARLWDASTGQPVGKPFGGHAGSVTSAVVSADGTHLVTTSADGMARVWLLHSDAPPLTLRNADRSVTSAAFSPDGRMIALAGDDGVARLFYTQLEDVLQLAKQRVTRVLTPEERTLYLRQP